MYCNNRNLVFKIVGYLLKVWQLVNARGAPGAPEINDSDFACFYGVYGFFKYTLRRNEIKVLTKAVVADFIAVDRVGANCLLVARICPGVNNRANKYS